MSELGFDVITGPVKRLVCRIRGHRPISGSAWAGSMACGRCGEGVRVRCSCQWDRPSARDLTGHRYDCPLHPPAGWPHDHQRPVGRVRVVEDEHGIRPVPWAEQRPAEARALVRDPNDRLWLLGDDGRVNRRIEPEELESWASWAEPSDIRAAEGEPLVVLPSRYVGIPFSISQVTWAEYVRLGGPPPGPPNPPRPPHDRPYA